MNTKRQTLETAIRLHLSDYPEDTRFRVKAFELWREPEGGWSANDAWYLSRNADKSEVLTLARGRWEVFKVNYMPRARVRDIQDIGWDVEHGISLECECTAFLDIEPVKE